MEENIENQSNREIIMGLDVSTATIGVCILLNDGSDYGKIIELTHINPKATKKKVNKVEELFLKKKCFEEFVQQFKEFGITKVVIEEPLLSSNNQNTVATLLRFNGMISDVIYNTFNVVPIYISSYDARKYSFPELMAIRKFNKNGEKYEVKKIVKAIKDSKYVLFGSYPWTVDKKTVIQQKVSEIFQEIPWIYDKNGELKKENFDASDSCVCAIAEMNREKYGDYTPITDNIDIQEDKIEYDTLYWNKKEHRITYLN
jgi:hypothetical protein